MENDEEVELHAIPGTPPDLTNPPKGDAFAPRNQYALAIDFEKAPPMFQISETHFARNMATCIKMLHRLSHRNL